MAHGSERGPSIPRQEALSPLRQKIAESLGHVFDDFRGHFITRKALSAERVDEIEGAFRDLAEEAMSQGEVELGDVLERISTRFYLLNTTGAEKDPSIFGEKAAEVLALVEVIVLTLGGSEARRVFKLIQEERER